MILLLRCSRFASNYGKNKLTSSYSNNSLLKSLKTVNDRSHFIIGTNHSHYNHFTQSTLLKTQEKMKLDRNYSRKVGDKEDKEKEKEEKKESEDDKKNEDRGFKTILGYNKDMEMPLLMKFYPRVFKNFVQSIGNWLKIEFYIKPYLDREFNLKEFLEGAKHAVVVISDRLASGNLDQIQDLVTQKAFSEIQENYKFYDLKKREQLRVEYSDIFACFAWKIRISKKSDKTFVDILVVFDVFRGMKGILDEQTRTQTRPSLSQFKDVFLENKFFLNYGFEREFSEDNSQSSTWIVNKLLHCKEKDFFRFGPLNRLRK